MKTLIVYANVHKTGFSGAILSEVIAKQRDFELIDLYEMKYDPVLKKEEHYSGGNSKIAKETSDFQKKIADADKLIFIYPIWWGTMPAILKGFFDRTLTAGFAFRYEGKRPKGLLNGKKAVVFFSMGAPSLYYKLLASNSPARAISNLILGFCGIKTKVYQVGSARHLDDKKKTEIKNVVEKGLGWLNG